MRAPRRMAGRPRLRRPGNRAGVFAGDVVLAVVVLLLVNVATTVHGWSWISCGLVNSSDGNATNMTCVNGTNASLTTMSESPSQSQSLSDFTANTTTTVVLTETKSEPTTKSLLASSTATHPHIPPTATVSVSRAVCPRLEQRVWKRWGLLSELGNITEGSNCVFTAVESSSSRVRASLVDSPLAARSPGDPRPMLINVSGEGLDPSPSGVSTQVLLSVRAKCWVTVSSNTSTMDRTEWTETAEGCVDVVVIPECVSIEDMAIQLEYQANPHVNKPVEGTLEAVYNFTDELCVGNEVARFGLIGWRYPSAGVQPRWVLSSNGHYVIEALDDVEFENATTTATRNFNVTCVDRTTGASRTPIGCDTARFITRYVPREPTRTRTPTVTRTLQREEVVTVFEVVLQGTELNLLSFNASAFTSAVVAILTASDRGLRNVDIVIREVAERSGDTLAVSFTAKAGVVARHLFLAVVEPDGEINNADRVLLAAFMERLTALFTLASYDVVTVNAVDRPRSVLMLTVPGTTTTGPITTTPPPTVVPTSAPTTTTAPPENTTVVATAAPTVVPTTLPPVDIDPTPNISKSRQRTLGITIGVVVGVVGFVATGLFLVKWCAKSTPNLVSHSNV